MENYFHMHMDPNQIKAISNLGLAHIGDGVFELLPLLSEEEKAFYRRGKNSHVHAVPKSCTPAEYAMATGLEALFGGLYLAGQTARINELFVTVMEELYGV